MDNPIIQLRDCNITSISYSHSDSEGCPTCGYGSSHCYDVVFSFDNKPNIYIDEDNSNYYSHHDYIDEAELITLILRNFNDILNMTYEDFRAFLSRHFTVN